MRFGIAFANVGPYVQPEAAVALARAAEDAGFESLWTVEHTVVPVGYESVYPYDPSGRMRGGEDAPIPDPLIWLTWVAAATTTLTLATGIIIVPQRNPLVLAKETATLATLSGGRLVLGVGAGWLAEEFAALGVPFEDRGKRLDDHIGALRALWSQSPARYEGPFVTFSDLHCEPRPPGGSIPVVIGGHSPAAARRAGRLGDGFFPAGVDVEKLESLIGEARRSAVVAGRDPDALEITSGIDRGFFSDPVGAVHRHEDLGVSRLMLPPLSFDPAEIGGALGRFHDDVMAKLG
jgi:probable F420-dependent oxidoreductase